MATMGIRRPKSIRAGLVLAGFARAWAALAAEPVRYFEPVDATEVDPETPYGLTVTGVLPGTPAEAAGIRAGDRVVGVDGLRVRDGNEYMCVRFVHDRRPDMALSLVRDGTRVSVRIPDPMPVRRAGFVFEAALPVFADTLRRWDLDPIALVTSCVQAAGASATNFARAAMDLFPARGKEAVTRALAGGDDGARERIRDLLRIYACLRAEQFANARDLAARDAVSGLRVHPFLGDLGAFYAALADRPPTPDSGVDPGAYGVDAFFFAHCYPYPLTRDVPVPLPGPEGTSALPGIYGWLAARSPAFVVRPPAGSSVPGRETHELAFAAAARAYAVVKAIEAYATRSGGGEEGDLRAIEDELAHAPTPGRLDAYIQVLLRLRPDAAFESLSWVAGYHASLHRQTPFDLTPAVERVLRPVEKSLYGSVAAALGAAETNRSTRGILARKWFERAACPSVCMLLSEDLRGAGEMEQARALRRKAVDFHQNLCAVQPAERHARACLMALRDLASLPGFSAEAARYRVPAASAGASAHVLAAILDSYAGNTDSMIRCLGLGFALPASDDAAPYPYAGRLHGTLADLRNALIRDVITRRLTKDEVVRLGMACGVDVRNAVPVATNETSSTGATFTAVLLEGNSVTGELDTAAIDLRTPYGAVACPVDRIHAVLFSGDRAAARVEFRNLDEVSGVVGQRVFRFRTGESTIEVEVVRLRRVSRALSQREELVRLFLKALAAARP